MSTALPVSAPQTSRRISIIAAATGLLAAAAIAVTIVVAGGGPATTADPYAAPAPHAHPDRGRLYRYEAAHGRVEQRSIPSWADRFHHFR
jgi:hypothetical protein